MNIEQKEQRKDVQDPSQGPQPKNFLQRLRTFVETQIDASFLQAEDDGSVDITDQVNEHVLTEEKQKQIQKIEAVSDDICGLFDKVEMILVIEGSKPSYLHGFAVDINDPKMIKENNERMKQFEDILKKIGFLFVKLQRLSDASDAIQYYSYCIAKEKENLDTLVKARKTFDAKGVGLALGYPETAVQAFGENNKEKNKVLEELNNTDIGKFNAFMPSEKHFLDDMRMTQRNMNIIKKVAPRLYRQVVSRVEQ